MVTFQIFSDLGFSHTVNTHKKIRTQWIKNLRAEFCHFNIQKYKNLFSKARSSRFLYVGYSEIMINIKQGARNFKFKYKKNILFQTVYKFSNQFCYNCD